MLMHASDKYYGHYNVAQLKSDRREDTIEHVPREAINPVALLNVSLHNIPANHSTDRTID